MNIKHPCQKWYSETRHRLDQHCALYNWPNAYGLAASPSNDTQPRTECKVQSQVLLHRFAGETAHGTTTPWRLGRETATFLSTFFVVDHGIC